MEALYQELLKGGAEAIEKLVSENRQESVELEFKTKENASHGQAEKSDRRNVGVTISAFANSMGGLLIWGIEARKNEDGVDCAQKLRPIKGIERFKSEIVRLISQAVTPMHEGIFVESIASKEESDSGFLLVHVLRSERRPHRCEFVEKQYFKRIGDSSRAMEHYDVEDSFKRLVVPTLNVGYRLPQGMGMSSGGGKEFKDLRIELMLSNASSATARFPYVILESISAPHQLGLPSGAIFRIQNFNNKIHFVGDADDVVHPDLPVPLVTITVTYEGGSIPERKFLIRKEAISPITIDFKCGCLHSRQSSGRLTIGVDEILAVDSSVQVR